MLVFDRRGRLLLFRGGDPARPADGTWWFTPGGGSEAGETARDAAARELREETGLAVGPGALAGPVWDQRTAFPFDGVLVEQSEDFFAVRVDLDGDDLVEDRTAWTELEHRSLVAQRWWDVDDLAGTADTVYPPGLAALARRVRPPGPGVAVGV